MSPRPRAFDGHAFDDDAFDCELFEILSHAPDRWAAAASADIAWTPKTVTDEPWVPADNDDGL